ncbi:hypothetical protein FDECE_17959 [Fusarium decemcellulare]|nr:hypothetical protein FDECE_17959 [Fusarium decemcellulare]
MAPIMHSSFQHAVDAAVTSCTTSIKQVVIVLLLGCYYFSHDLPRPALRACGTAGRMLMELGFHNSDVLNGVLKSEVQRQQVSILTCSVMILDRQWSAMTGLPANFPSATFSPMSAYLGDAPYIKAMYRLILISDRFNEPIYHSAKGNGYEDDDEIELLVFQIQQWQKKSVGDRDLGDMKVWLAQPSTVPPSWLLLLMFRAASIQSLLLRSYFFPTSDVEKSKQHLVPAMKLASNVTEALSGLDSATTIYRNQRPYYQHILASICALMFLVAGYVEQHRSTFLPYLPAGYDGQIRHCFQLASKLAQKYADVSKTADILWTRIRELCQAMENHGLHSGDGLRDPPSSTTTTDGPAAFSLAETREEVLTNAEETYGGDELYSFGATLDLELAIDGDNSFLQDIQTWGLSGWPSNSHSYLFQ